MGSMGGDDLHFVLILILMARIGASILTLDPDPAGSGDAPVRLDARHSQADLQGLPLQALLLLEAGTQRSRGT